MKIKTQRIGAPRFEIEVNPNDKVPDLKKKIEAVLGAKDFPAARQFLIYRGHFIISANDTLRELNVVISVFAITRIMLPEEACGFTIDSARAACSSFPAPVISSAVSKLDDDRKANLDVVARSELISLCARTQSLELKSTLEEEFEWEACENETSAKLRDGFM